MMRVWPCEMPLLFGFLLKLLGRAIDALDLRLVSRCLLSNSVVRDAIRRRVVREIRESIARHRQRASLTRSQTHNVRGAFCAPVFLGRTEASWSYRRPTESKGVIILKL
jgi:hypothetical protein